MSALTPNRHSAQTQLIKDDDSKVDLGRADEVGEVLSPNSQSPRSALKGNDGVGSDDVDYIDYGTHLPTTAADAATEEKQPYSIKLHFFRDAQSQENVWIRRVKGALRNAWRTKLTDNVVDRESFIKTSVRELVLYLGFVVIICIITLGVDVGSPKVYDYTKVMKDTFVNTPDINSYTKMEQFWEYTNNILGKELFEGNPNKRYVLSENWLLTAPQLRQLRVSNDSCTVAKEIRHLTPECFPPYSKSDEDKSKIYVIPDGETVSYKTSEQLNGTDRRGYMELYDGGGYVVLLKRDSQEAQKTLKHLKEMLWLDRGTRAVFIDFSVYNANVNLFCVVTLLFEFPPAGGVIANSHVQTVKLLRYENSEDKFVLICKVFLFFYTLYYTIEELIEIRMLGLSYFCDVWNCFDILLVAMGYVTLVFAVYIHGEVENVLTRKEPNLTDLCSWVDDFKQFDSVFVFLAMIKIFKYVSFNKSMTQLQSTLSRCAKDIAAFAVMFFIVFFAYVQWGYLMFSNQLQDFSTFQYCIYTLFRIILGDFNFPAMESAQRVMGPIYFITYMFFVFFVLINMFLAIINDTYAEVKEELSQEESEFEFSDYFKNGYSKFVNKISFRREKIVDIQEALFTADSNQDNVLDAEEFRSELMSRGYGEEEIETMFAKYDLDGDRVLGEQEIKQMHYYLEEQKNALNEEMERVNQMADDFENFDSGASSLHGLSDDSDTDDGSVDDDGEFAVLTRRVDRLEHSIGNILSKLGSVLSKLDAMEEVRNKRRETMCRLLDSVRRQIDERNDNETTHMEDTVRNELKRWKQ